MALAQRALGRHAGALVLCGIISAALFYGDAMITPARGTAKVAAFFGPLMVIWFVVIALSGVLAIADDATVLAALDPIYGLGFLAGHGKIGLITLGAVF